MQSVDHRSQRPREGGRPAGPAGPAGTGGAGERGVDGSGEGGSGASGEGGASGASGASGEGGSRTRRTWLPELIILVIGAEVTRHIAWPLRPVGLAFAIAAIVVGVLAMADAPRSPRSGRPLLLLPALGLVAGTGLLLAHLVLLAWGLLAPDYEQCVDGALTRTAMETCEADLRRQLLRVGE